MEKQRTLPMVGELLTCADEECERKILVERALAGSEHTVVTVVRCWEHLSEEVKQGIIETYHLEHTEPS